MICDEHHIKLRILTSIFFVAALVVTASEEVDPDRDFGFRPLEIYRFKAGTSSVLAEDINDDGLDDIIFINNRDSRLEILVRKKDAVWDKKSLPALKDTFENKGMIVDQGIGAVRLVNLNADKRTDILTFGRPLGLQKRIQSKDGSFGRPEKIYIDKPAGIIAIQADDLDKNGMTDIVVARRGSIDLLWNDKDNSFIRRDTLQLSDEFCHGLELADVNDDGHLDLLIYFKSVTIPIKVRLGDGKGEFGLEYPLDLPPQRFVRLVSKGNGHKPQLGCVLKNGLGVRLYSFSKENQPELLKAQEIVPQMIALSSRGQKSASSWIAGDFNKDKYDDIILAASELSQLHFYNGCQEGLKTSPEKIDTLSAVDSLHRLSDGNILVVSGKEKSAAIHDMKRLKSFPAIVKLPGEVVSGTCLRSKEKMFFVCRDASRKLVLVERGIKTSDAVTHKLEINNDPKAMKAMDLGADGIGIMIFMPYEVPVMYRVVDGGIKKVDVADFRALSSTLISSQVSFFKENDDKSIVVSNDKTARMFEWADGRFTVKRQFNPGNNNAQVIASCSYRGNGDGRGTMIYDQTDRSLVWYSDDEERNPVKVHLKKSSSDLSGLVHLKSGKNDLLVMIGKKDLGLVMAGRDRIILEPGPEYMSPSERPLITSIRDVSLAGPMRPMLALVETANRSIELISVKDGRELKKELIFQVFLDAGFTSRSTRFSNEPHGLVSGDINGDKTGDLILLVHDKLLIYLGD